MHITVDGVKITKPQIIADNFGQFYSTLGSNLAMKIDNNHLDIDRYLSMSWPENQGILFYFFYYISKTLQMNWISFMASLLNAVL